MHSNTDSGQASHLLSVAARDVDTPRRIKTKNDLMNAAFEVFVEKGIDGASIDELASRAGYTRGAFHSNFESKEALFLATLNRELLREQEAMRRHLDAFEANLLETCEQGTTIRMLASAITSALFEGNLYGRVTLYQELRLLALQNRDYAVAYSNILTNNFQDLEQHIHQIDNEAEAHLSLDASQTAQRILALFTNELLDIAIRREDIAQAQERILTLLVDILASLVSYPEVSS